MPRKKTKTPNVIAAPLPIFSVTGLVTMRELQDRYIAWVIELCGDNKEEAAKQLRISSKTIYNRKRRKGIVDVSDSEQYS